MIRAVGPIPARIMLIGESPGEVEEREGVPFVGMSGKVLDGLLRDAGIVREQCYITNVVLTRPPSNNFQVYYDKGRPTVELQEAIRRLHEEIIRVQPNVVVTLGEEALRAVTGKHGVTSWRGSVLKAVTGHKVVATVHPALVSREWTYRPAAQMDLVRAREQSMFPEIIQTERTLVVDYNFDSCLTYLKEIKDNAWEVAFDIENETSQITCISFAPNHRPNWSISIPFWFGSSGSLFTEVQEVTLWGVIREILTDVRIGKIAHNGIYDIEFIYRTMGFRVEGLVFDTLLGMHALYLELPKSLAFAVSIYTDHPYYKDRLHSTNMDDFFKYNALDSCLTMELATKLRQEIREDGLWEFYQQYLNSLVLPVLEMQIRGVRFDHQKRNLVKKQVQEEVVVLQESLNALAGRELNTNSPKQMKEWMYGKEGLNLKERTKKRKDTGETTVSADEDAIESAYRESGHEGLRRVLEIREKQKVLGTFLEVALDEDKRIRCSYNIAGTETGRFSSGKTTRGTGTNLQNIPSGTVRSLFIPDDGKVFINADLSQAEARVVAYLSNESRLIRVFEEGGDIHRKNAANIFGCGEEQVTDDQRQLAKRVVHASNYGMGPITFARTAGCSAAEARRLLNQYFATYPGIANWHLDIKQQLRNKRYLINPFGRKRIFYNRWEDSLFKEGLAFIPQSTVADIVNQALVCLHAKGVELLLQVHDSVLVQAEEGKTQETAELLRKCLSVPIEINGRILTVPVDVKVGNNWQDLKKFEGVVSKIG